MIATIKDRNGFMNGVFAAEGLLKSFPELETVGVNIHELKQSIPRYLHKRKRNYPLTTRTMVV